MRFAITLLLTFWATQLTALCTGASFMDRLTDAERAEIAANVAATPYPSGLFWTASKGDKTLHLIGTMHITDRRLDAVLNRAAPLVEAADLLMVEATKDDEAALQARFAANPEMIFIMDGPTLPERLDEETWQALSEATRARMVPPFMAAKMQPWYLSLTLAIPPCIMSEMMSGQRGLDHMVMGVAEDIGVPIQSVEDPLAVMTALSGGTFEEQLEALKLSLLAPDLQSEMFVAMLSSYFAEDIAEIWEASRIAVNYVPELDPATAEALFADMEQNLLIQRNKDWIPVIEAAFAEVDTITLAVGAAHIPGAEGVLSLMEASGWTIAPAAN